MGLSVNASYNIGMNTGAYPGAGGAGVMDDETQSKLYQTVCRAYAFMIS